jgi:hypothetical protein
MNLFWLAGAVAALSLAGCAGGSPLFSNVAKPYIYSPQERAYAPGKASYEIGATGQVSYCDAGLSQLVAARRKEALDSIASVCGGEEKYRIQGEGGGGAAGHSIGNFAITPSCNRGKTIVFKCLGAEPKYDRSK